MKKTVRKWTKNEEMRVAKQIKAYPTNLARCFLLLSEELDRTPSAIENRWYTRISKDPEVLAFFTASPVHFAKNRKNGAGTEINRSIWQRLVRIIKSIM